MRKLWIYKITNDINGKIYIGQSARNVKERFQRHINDAISNRLQTHLCRAIRKYGMEHFHYEIIDTASSQEELNLKEHYWINYYNSVKIGYNETDSITKSGGNTYLNKTEEEMKVIREKIRLSKIGGKNPNARKIDVINLETKEVLTFDSIIECAHFFNCKGKTALTQRLNKKVVFPYRKKYQIKYHDE